MVVSRYISSDGFQLPPSFSFCHHWSQRLIGSAELEIRKAACREWRAWWVSLASYPVRPRLFQSSPGWDSQVPSLWLCDAAKSRTSNCALQERHLEKATSLLLAQETLALPTTCGRTGGTPQEGIPSPVHWQLELMNPQRRRTCSALRV